MLWFKNSWSLFQCLYPSSYVRFQSKQKTSFQCTANIKQPCDFTRSLARCKTGAIWYQGFWNKVLTLLKFNLLKSHGFRSDLNQINLINFMSFFIWLLHIQDLKRNSLTIFYTIFFPYFALIIWYRIICLKCFNVGRNNCKQNPFINEHR